MIFEPLVILRSGKLRLCKAMSDYGAVHTLGYVTTCFQIL